MRFVAADALVTALETTVSIGVVWALGMLEFLFYRTMFGWDGDVLNAINLFQWQNALLFVLAMTVFNLFLMAFLNRFGIKVFFLHLDSSVPAQSPPDPGGLCRPGGGSLPDGGPGPHGHLGR